MKILAMTLTALAMASVQAIAADATGKWEAKIPGPRGEMAFVFDLNADGESLTGTISNEMMGESEITDGKVSGDEVSFKQVMERGDRKITFSYAGTVSGDEMTLTRTMEGMGGGGRAKAGPPPGGRGGEGGGTRRGGMGREIAFTATRLQ